MRATSGFSSHTIEEIKLSSSEIKHGLPFVFDSSSLAFTLGIRNRTLWWLITTNVYKKQKRGDGMYEHIQIPKKSGGVRHIHEPMEALKNVQKVLLRRFFDHIPAPRYLGAYVPGRDLAHTYEQHTGKKTLISTDIRDFFPSITRYRVRKWLASLGYNSKIQNYLSNLVCVPVRRKNQRPHKPDHIYVLPQGAPTSSALSNHVVRSGLDEPFIDWLDTTFDDATYTRYADNIEISFDVVIPRSDYHKILAKLDEILKSIHMHRHPSKTRIRYPKNQAPMRVLGVSVQEHANIPRPTYKRLRGMVHDIWVNGLGRVMQRTDLEARSLNHGLEIIRGQLQHWQSVNKERLEDTLEKWSEIEARYQEHKEKKHGESHHNTNETGD